MPDLDGFGVLSLLRREGHKAPIVMLSGSARQFDIDRAYALGCSDYPQKPSTLADYRQVARTILDYWRRSALPAY
jgi:CheY-like chemotaxis protein